MDGELVASVVVATHNRCELLPRLFDALAAQTEGRFELIIVDDASGDDTPAVLQRLAADAPFPVVIRRQAVNRGPATARNVGWRTASSSTIAFTDDDCVPQPTWLATLVRGLDDFDLVQGMTVPDPAQHHRWGDFSHTIEALEPRGWYQTCNIGYRRSVIERIGGFDEDFFYAYGEDADLAWRAKESGAVDLFEPDALVYHDVSDSRFLDKARRMPREVGVVLLVARHPELRKLLHGRGWLVREYHPAAVLAVVTGAIAAASPRRPGRVAMAILALGLYLRQRPLRIRRRYKPLVAPLTLALDLEEIAVLAAASIRYRTVVL